jgi:nucleoside-diphosphate-sugar epimerase
VTTRYLVTGGMGSLGAPIVHALLRSGAELRVLDDQSRGSTHRLADVSSDIEVVDGDVRDPTVVHKAVQGVESVIHLAYVNGTSHFYTRPEVVLEVAVKGMMNLLDACATARVGEFVLASSSEVYQVAPHIPTDESAPLSIPDPLNPRYSYGGGKIISELLAINYGRKLFDRVLIFRPHNVYGPDMGEDHVIPQLALSLIEKSRSVPQGTIELPIQGSGKETRSFVYIDDLVAGVLAILQKGQHLNIYHVGNDDRVAIADLAGMIAGCLDREIRVISGPAPVGSPHDRCPDIGKLRSLGYSPHVALSDGLPRTVRWYLEHSEARSSASGTI